MLRLTVNITWVFSAINKNTFCGTRYLFHCRLSLRIGFIGRPLRRPKMSLTIRSKSRRQNLTYEFVEIEYVEMKPGVSWVISRLLLCACLPNLKFVSLAVLELRVLAFNARTFTGSRDPSRAPFRKFFGVMSGLFLAKL